MSRPLAKNEVFIVVPAFNEAAALKAVLSSLVKCGYSVVAVDDGSADATWEVIEGLPVHGLRHPINLGQGAALQTGMTYAVSQGARVVVHFDADGQHRFRDIESLIAPIVKGEADVVLGSRFLRKSHRSLVPGLRQVMLQGARVVNGCLTGLWLTDAHNGLRAFSGEAASKIRIMENGYAHASEILSLIKSARLKYVERPTKIYYTSYSLSKGQSIFNSFNILWDLLVRGVLR